MVNRYAPWRYFLLALVIVIGAVYAAPNLYGEDPALQISHRVNLIDESELNNIRSLLETEGIEHRSVELDGNNVLVRFDSEDAQLRAASRVRDLLQASDTRYGVALNLAPATPDWLTSLNALPMYLGLDLRGGVHFLMEVDMDAAIEKSMERAAGELRSFMREEKIRYKAVQANKTSISVRFTSQEDRDSARQKLEDEYRDFEFDAQEPGQRTGRCRAGDSAAGRLKGRGAVARRAGHRARQGNPRRHRDSGVSPRARQFR